MPNRNNIESPICLVGLGRSGTTLITNAFRKHPEFQSLGETANLVYSTFYSIEKSLPMTGPRNGPRSDQIVARDCVHNTLIDIYGSPKPRWFQKPIFTPEVRIISRMTPREFESWYWSTSRILFPGGKFFTILRKPEDVVKSSMIRWNWGFDQAIAVLRRSYSLLSHSESRLGAVFDFKSIATEPEAFLQAVFEFAEVPFDDACLTAFEQSHAQNKPKAVEVGEIPIDIMDAYSRILTIGT